MPRDENKEVDDVYSDNFNESLEDNDEISEAEEGFMQGYNEDDIVKECKNCQNILDDHFIEQEISNKRHGFCSKIFIRDFRGVQKFIISDA